MATPGTDAGVNVAVPVEIAVTLKHVRHLSAALLVVSAAMGAAEIKAQQVTVDESAQAYRRIHVDVEYLPNEATAGFEVWYSDSAFVSTGDAQLHSHIRVADTAGLVQALDGEAYEDCWSDGDPVFRDAAGNPVVSPDATNWSCSLGGMIPGAEQWIAVVPVGGDGAALIDTESLEPVAGRTDTVDERTPPPDTRPITFALGSVILSAIALLSFLYRQDSRRG